MGGRSKRGWATLIVVLLVACAPAASVDPPPDIAATTPITTPAPADSTPASDPTTSSVPDDTEPPVSDVATAAPSSECPAVGGTPMRADASITLEPLPVDGDLAVYAGEYPLPGPTEGLWSQWGEGVVANGRHYSAIGDHLGPDGNSYLYEYDPGTRNLTRVMDVLSLVDHQPGAWGYGKIHSQMVIGQCGTIWTFTYWGTRRDIEYGDGYEGDLLLEIDPMGRTVVSHGALAGERGVPSLIASTDGRFLVGEAVEADTDDGELVVVDTGSAAVAHVVDDPGHVGFRSLARDPGGAVLYSVDDQSLMALDPASGETSESGVELPGGDDEDFLRAATPPTDEGRVFAVTQETDILFSIEPGGEVTELGSAEEYTASLAITPEEDRVFWFPGAHGNASEVGGFVYALDTATGEITEVVSLLEPFEELGLLAGGTYSISYHEGSLILGVNASPLDDDSGFGTVILVVIEGL